MQDKNLAGPLQLLEAGGTFFADRRCAHEWYRTAGCSPDAAGPDEAATVITPFSSTRWHLLSNRSYSQSAHRREARSRKPVPRHGKTDHPPATILTISSRSPARSGRRENSEGATASPLCSTTTLRGSSFWAIKNSSIEHGTAASTGFPLAMIWLTAAFSPRLVPTSTLCHPRPRWFLPHAVPRNEPRPNGRAV